MLLLILTGFLSGIITGMGLGGIILIPALTMLLDFEQKAAQGINLVYFIPTSLIALSVHIKNKNVDFKTATPLIIWGVIGAIAGSVFADKLPSDLLRKLFAYLLLLIGGYQIAVPLWNKIKAGFGR